MQQQGWGIRVRRTFGEAVSLSGEKCVSGFVLQKHSNVKTIKVQLRKAAVTLNFSEEGGGGNLESESGCWGIFVGVRGIKFKTEFSGIEYAANNKCENKFQSNTIFRETAGH